MQNIDRGIYGAALLLAVGIYIVTAVTIPSEGVRAIRMAELYALAGLFFLYGALVASPLYALFPRLWGASVAKKIIQALGVAAFAFGLVHAYIAFFKMLGGFAGLGFLSSRYTNAIVLSTTALLMLGVAALFSWDAFTKKFARAKFVTLVCLYISGLLTIIHAIMLGAHFADLTKLIPQLALYLLFILFVIDAYWLDAVIAERLHSKRSFGVPFVLLVAMLVSAYTWYAFPQNSGSNTTLGIHAQHLQGLQNTGTQSRQDRYTLTIITEPTLIPSQDTQLSFKVFNAATGSQVRDFTLIHDRLMHLVIVNNGLTYYRHIHPELQSNGAFTVTTSFPAHDVYRLYATFQPAGGSEQELAQTVDIGGVAVRELVVKRDEGDTKTFGNVRVRIVGGTTVARAEAQNGNAILTFELSDVDGNPVTNLRPYLGAFGHLVMINANDYRYVHVHPLLAPISPDEAAGPLLDFALVANVEPGVYRLFLDINPGGELMTADFTIEVR